VQVGGSGGKVDESGWGFTEGEVRGVSVLISENIWPTYSANLLWRLFNGLPYWG